MLTNSSYVGGAIAMAAVIGATIAVCLGKIDAAGFTGIVGAFGGIGAGAGAHAAGVNQAKP